MQQVRAEHFDAAWKWWLPPNHSSFGEEIDLMYIWIFWITMVTFVVVEGVMVYFCFKYRRNPARKATYIAGSHKLEVAWTVIPAIILVALGVASTNTWAKIKNSSDPSYPQEFQTEVKIAAQQFAWNVTYPGTDRKFDTADDFMLPNILNVPVELKDGAGNVTSEENVRIMLSSKDVIHSLFIPVLRVKQDAVPGYIGNVWFDCDRATYAGPDGKHLTGDQTYSEDGKTLLDWEEAYEIACAELCGLGHSGMRMQLKVVPRAAWEAWVKVKSDEAKKRAEGG
ncbi:MAG: cytochrome c oxidase subunit II [Planctomycetes bacterium]|nr:cytochrome c oxidase subunit II [Planctomycetota bacterium]